MLQINLPINSIKNKPLFRNFLSLCIQTYIIICSARIQVTKVSSKRTICFVLFLSSSLRFFTVSFVNENNVSSTVRIQIFTCVNTAERITLDRTQFSSTKDKSALSCFYKWAATGAEWHLTHNDNRRPVSASKRTKQPFWHDFPISQLFEFSKNFTKKSKAIIKLNAKRI